MTLTQALTLSDTAHATRGVSHAIHGPLTLQHYATTHGAPHGLVYHAMHYQNRPDLGVYREDTNPTYLDRPELDWQPDPAYTKKAEA